MCRELKLIDFDGYPLSNLPVDGLNDAQLLQKRIEVADAYNMRNGDGYFQLLEDGKIINKLEIPLH